LEKEGNLRLDSEIESNSSEKRRFVMLVQDWMSSKVITVDDEASIMKTSKLMKQNGIQHLPVLKEQRLIGIISDRDLKEAQPSKASSLDIYELYYLLDEVKVKSAMPPNLFTISLEETVEKAAAIMLKHNISALPVVNPEGGLAGIIAKGDVFRAFVSISGIHQAELQIGLQLEDQPGSIGEVASAIRAHAGRVVSILTEYDRAPEGFRFVYIRAKDVGNEQALFEELEGKFKVLYRSHDKLD
jgi:acetoin utilization protein AcuB